jgi:hypothetical protein
MVNRDRRDTLLLLDEVVELEADILPNDDLVRVSSYCANVTVLRDDEADTVLDACDVT